jgi:hypothetical protein
MLDSHITAMTRPTDKTDMRELQRIDGNEAWAEYQAQQNGIEANIARQRAARLAKLASEVDNANAVPEKADNASAVPKKSVLKKKRASKAPVD